MAETKPGEVGPVRKCRSCEALIMWARTPSGGKIPLDAQPERRFVFDQSGGPPDAAPVVVLRETYTTHFATCPNADQHRKSRGRASPKVGPS